MIEPAEQPAATKPPRTWRPMAAGLLIAAPFVMAGAALLWSAGYLLVREVAVTDQKVAFRYAKNIERTYFTNMQALKDREAAASLFEPGASCSRMVISSSGPVVVTEMRRDVGSGWEFNYPASTSAWLWRLFQPLERVELRVRGQAIVREDCLRLAGEEAPK